MAGISCLYNLNLRNIILRISPKSAKLAKFLILEKNVSRSLNFDYSKNDRNNYITFHYYYSCITLGSFNIQEFNHEELPGSLVATFEFTPGSTLKDLILNITGSHSNKNTTIIVTRPSGSDSLIVTKKISPFPAGMYNIQVIEGGNKTVFDIHVSIPSPSISISVTTATTTITTSISELLLILLTLLLL